MKLYETEEFELTVLMPCLNEEKTIDFCIQEAKRFICKRNLSAEVLIADNGSTDASREIAEKAGARVVSVPKKGYGAALREGLAHSKGKYIIFADCDSTYDFEHMDGLYDAFLNGSDAVVGDRYADGFPKGSTPFTHWVGVRALSKMGRIKFHSDVKDFHCGLRGLSRALLETLEFKTDGFEFATEFVAEISLSGHPIENVPVTLRKCIVERTPHLKAFSDGMRHFKYICTYKKKK